MALSLKVVVILLALILFGIAAIGVPTQRFNLIAAGLFLWLAADTFG